jgi:hypothetical protein
MVFLEDILVFSNPAIQIIESILGFLEGLRAT